MTMMGALNTYYGDVLPNETYPNYTPDEVDSENSDLQAAVIGYGATELETENENLPPTFIVAGENDDLSEPCVDLYRELRKRGIHSEVHIFADTPHGFILGQGALPSNLGGNTLNGVKEWPTLMEAFLDIELGYIPRVTNN